jgi:hypothetical protein
MANISSYFGGSGGGTAADPTLNGYGVPLPQYITCYAYKDTCIETQGVANVCCGGWTNGGIVPLEGNTFIALAAENGRSGDQDCHRLFAKAYCIDDSTGEIYSGQTAYTNVFCSSSTNQRVGYETNPRATGDGCKSAYVPILDGSHDRLLRICVNSLTSPSSVGTSTICGYVHSNSQVRYGGQPGVVAWQSCPGHASCACVVRIENGSVTFCNSLGFDNSDIRCGGAGGSPSLSVMCVLSPDAIVQVGFCNSSSCYCTRTANYYWNKAAGCYTVSSCNYSGTGYLNQQGYTGNWNRCCFNVPGILQRSMRIGPSFYQPGQGAAFMAFNPARFCDLFNEAYACLCSACGYHFNSKAYYNPTGTWNIETDYMIGCFGSKTDCQTGYGMHQLNLIAANGSCWDPLVLSVQSNGVLSSGLFGNLKGRCTECSYRQQYYTSYEVEQDINKLSSYQQVPLYAYGEPQTCRVFCNDVRNFMGSAVVGKKWIVSMESSMTGACECIALHSYKIMTNSCTAD